MEANLQEQLRVIGRGVVDLIER
ncbi:MAG: hypothetical protein RL112_2904, partial [Planctomycetota bacterium]